MEEVKNPVEGDYSALVIKNKNITLETGRLLLRRISVNDLNPLYLIRSDEETARLIGKQAARNQGEVLAYIEKINEGIKLGKWLYWSILSRVGKNFLGTICLWNFSEETAEVGYELLPQMRGRGYAFEALEAVVNFAFETFTFNHLEAYVNASNIKSIELLRRSSFKVVGEVEEVDEVSPGFVKMLICSRERSIQK